ncbi:HrpF/NolX family T3SS translocon protein, partial [Xanthomonas euvesicatoria]
VDTAIQGGDMSLALKLAGINMAGAVVGAVGGPTARIGAKGVAKGVAEAAAKEAAEGAAKGAAKGTAKSVAKGGGKTAAERPSAAEFAKGYVGGTAISKSTEILKTPVLAGLHYEEYQLDKQKDGEIHQKMENAGGVPVGKQIIPKGIADNFEGDLRQNLRNVRIRRR